MHGIARDLRIAVRNLVRTPGFTSVVVLTLALGIGANAAIFSVVNAVLLRPLPFPDPDRLAVVWETRDSQPGYHMFASPPNFFDWREGSTQFERLAAFTGHDVFLAGRAETVRVRGAQVTDGLFEVVGVRPILGRTVRAQDNVPGAERVVLLSHGLWQREFAGDPGIIGQSVSLDNGPRTVIGVMPEGFDFPPPIDLEGAKTPRRAELWIPFTYDASTVSGPSRSAHYWTVVGRLGAVATHASAEAELRTVAGRLQQEYPDSNEDWNVLVEPFRQVIVGDVSRALLVLFGAVGAVLLIACVNIANLMIARSTGHQREYAIRAALGAGRPVLVRQALVESQVLSILGGTAGILLAWWGVQALRRFLPASVPRAADIGIDPVVIGFAFTAAILTGLLFGLVPALRAFTPDLVQFLRSGDRGGEGGAGHGRLRGLLVVSEVALSLVLLVVAALLFTSFLAIRAEDTGYSVDRVLTMRTALPLSGYGEEVRRAAAFRDIEERISALPGVSAAGFARDIPLAADFQGTTLILADEPPPPPDDPRNVNFGLVTPGWLDAMRLNVVAGRSFSASDDAAAPDVIVVNQELVRRHMQGREPLGRQIRFGGTDAEPRLWTIIGVVADARIETLGADPPPAMFFPRSQGAQRPVNMGLVVRATDAALPIAEAVRSVILDFDPAIAVFDIRTMDDVLAESVAQPRFSALMLLMFSAVALLLASIGIYGVISYDVGRREREIGIRMALGARPADAQRLVVGRGLRLVGGGIAVGLVAALALTRLLRSLLYEVSPTDPITLAGASVLLIAVALLAAWIPARRASRMEPVMALRME